MGGYNFSAVSAAKSIAMSRQFGGRIISPQAIEIIELEATGYVCPSYGSTISIAPIGSPEDGPTSYFIPYNTTSRTKIAPAPGQLIIGKYGTKTIITCFNPSDFSMIPVYLDTILIFGNSRI